MRKERERGITGEEYEDKGRGRRGKKEMGESLSERCSEKNEAGTQEGRVSREAGGDDHGVS
jgi:hypothetical protein